MKNKTIFFLVLIQILLLLIASTATANQPPTAPEVAGPNDLKVGKSYSWTFVSTDPDGDDITYYVDWGDECGGAEWHGPYPSGQEIVLPHTYYNENVLIVQTLAVDDEGAESDFTYFEVTITKKTAVYRPFFNFLENHPIMFLLIKHLLLLK